jgi:hypothetical protein
VNTGFVDQEELRKLEWPTSPSFLSGFSKKHVNQTFAGVFVHPAKDLGGNSNQESVELSLIPALIKVMQLILGKA